MNIIELTDVEKDNLLRFLDRVEVKGLNEIGAIHVIVAKIMSSGIQDNSQLGQE